MSGVDERRHFGHEPVRLLHERPDEGLALDRSVQGIVDARVLCDLREGSSKVSKWGRRPGQRAAQDSQRAHLVQIRPPVRAYFVEILADQSSHAERWSNLPLAENQEFCAGNAGLQIAWYSPGSGFCNG